MMTATIDVKASHAAYRNTPTDLREAIDSAYEAAVLRLMSRGVRIAEDDRAEELIAAIAHFVQRSSEGK